MSSRTTFIHATLASLLPLLLACGGAADEEGISQDAVSAASNPFSFATGRDEFLSCYGIAGGISSNCRDIADVNQKALCLALSTHSQQPCATMTDRNLQLSCYGMSINVSSNCRSITVPNQQQFCYGVSGHSLSNCTAVTDRSSQLLCYAMADGINSNCRDITNANDRNFCYAISAHNNSTCANIASCNPGFKLCGTACIDNSACCTNADCPIANGVGTCSAGTCLPTPSQCNPPFNACGDSCSSAACCNTAADCPVVANGVAACVNQACVPTCDSGFNTCAGNPSTALCLPAGECCSNASCGVDPARELVVVDPSVVNDPRGISGNWSFAHLMQGLSGGQADPSAFVLAWLASWTTNESVNGFLAASRPSITNSVIEPWLQLSGCAVQAGCNCATGAGCALNFGIAPFKLKAIVSRLDLRSSAHAGEGRFIFGVETAPAGSPGPFTVIFEYELMTGARTVQQWAADWHALGTLPLGSPAYLSALETITERFAGIQIAPGRFNGSALHQLRTNEIFLAAPWELREFHLGSNGLLFEAAVAQTPDDLSANHGAPGSPALASWINANAAAILAGTHQLPATMLGASSPNTLFPAPTWNVPGVNDPQVMARSPRATCAGCHGTDTRTQFLHVDPQSPGTAALSSFVQTAEIPRREADLAGILNGTANLSQSAIHAAALSE